MKSLFLAFILAATVTFAEEPKVSFMSSTGSWFKVDNTNCVVWNSFPRQNETVIWTGGTEDGKAHGYGELTWYTNGYPTTKYVGYMERGMRDGQGTITKGELILEGEWEDGVLTSKIMKDKWPDGTSYVGEHIKGVRNGKGKVTFADGSWYEGGFVNAKQHGFGEETMRDGGRYIGEYKNGKFNGRGKYTYPSGDVLEGLWENSLLLGTGTYTTVNGDMSKVTLINGKMTEL